MYNEIMSSICVVVTDFLKANTGEDLSDIIQEVIIKNPNRVIFFPDGEYCLAKPILTSANPKKSVCLHLSNYAVIKAINSRDSDEALIRLGALEPYNNVEINGSNYYLSGGIIDGNNVANGVL